MISTLVRIAGLIGLFASLPACLGASVPTSQVSTRTVPGRDIIEPVRVIAIQREQETPGTRYDWGPCVMYADGLYRMWWCRLGGSGQAKRFPYRATLPDGEVFEFTYPDWGDRIYYAESRDGTTWHIDGDDDTGDPSRYGPDAQGGMMVLRPAENAQQRNHLAAPCVIRVDGTYYCYAEACSEYKVRRGTDGKIAVGDEYHNQVFLATSSDGRRWRQYPSDDDPQPIVAAPPENKRPERQRYGLGQPSVFYRDGRFVMHYVDSCTGPGDFIVRIEADNPYFRNARRSERALTAPPGAPPFPKGSVARFAQVDVRSFRDLTLLVRPAYETGNLNLLASRDGVFREDLQAHHPREVFPQVRTQDARGPLYLERCFPRFLTDQHGEIREERGNIVIYYGSGKLGKPNAHTWDLHRAEIAVAMLAPR